MKNKYIIYLLDDSEFLSEDDRTTFIIHEAKTFNNFTEAVEYYKELGWNQSPMYLQVREYENL